MLEQALTGIRTKQDLRTYILERGCYSQEENLRIHEKWFANAPRYLFRAVDKKYGITKKALCDVGCAYGMNLLYCTPDSFGIEIDEQEAVFARSLGLTVYQRDVLKDDLSDLPNVEVVWCSAVLEHVDSPHTLLRRLHQLLREDGLLVLFVPTIPLFPSLRHVPKLGRFFSGHLASDHINAFVPSTIRFICERAGFETIEVSPFYPGFLSILDRVGPAGRLVDGCVYVGRKIEGWDYPGKSTRKMASERCKTLLRDQSIT